VSKPVGLIISDRAGHRIGALVVFGPSAIAPGARPCSFPEGCQYEAIAAVIPDGPGGEPQLTCGTHLGRIHETAWRGSNSPRLRVVDASRLLTP
jgi:hypothetical protein